jgi:hypothetical protein
VVKRKKNVHVLASSVSTSISQRFINVLYKYSRGKRRISYSQDSLDSDHIPWIRVGFLGFPLDSHRIPNPYFLFSETLFFFVEDAYGIPELPLHHEGTMISDLPQQKCNSIVIKNLDKSCYKVHVKNSQKRADCVSSCVIHETVTKTKRITSGRIDLLYRLGNNVCFIKCTK